MNKLSKRWLRGSACTFIFLIISLAANPIFAAKQGVLGSTSSGSVGISLHIPDTKRLYVAQIGKPHRFNISNLNTAKSRSSNQHFCLSILDLTSKRAMRQYKVKASSLSDQYEFSIVNADEQKVMSMNEDIQATLVNQMPRPQKSRGRCQEDSTYLSVEKKSGASFVNQENQLTLTLIPE